MGQPASLNSSRHTEKMQNVPSIQLAALGLLLVSGVGGLQNRGVVLRIATAARRLRQAPGQR